MDITTLDLQSILGGIVAVGTVLGIFIEVTPIKINPVSIFLEYVGSKLAAGFTKEIKKDISEIKTDVSDLKMKVEKIDGKVDENEIDRIRWEILDFSNSCRNKRKHTRDEFLHIIDLGGKYHDILEERDLTNGRIDIEYPYILEIYKKCLANNSFLCANGDDDC